MKMKMNDEKARDSVVDTLVKTFPNLRAFADKPYSFVVPMSNDKGEVSYVKVGVTSCSHKIDIPSTTLPANQYVVLERQAREFTKQLTS